MRSGGPRGAATAALLCAVAVLLLGACGAQVAGRTGQTSPDGARPPALRLCGQLGCRPPVTGCTPASYDQALIAVGAPAHTYRDSQDCDGKWLVLDFSWRTGPACGDATGSGCSSRLGDRWFFRAESSGWVPIADGAAGGCRDVQRDEPGFPTSMCDAPAPLPTALHPSYAPPSSSPAAASPSG